MAGTNVGLQEGSSALVLEDVTSDSNFQYGIVVSEDATLDMHRCAIQSTDAAITTNSTIDVELVTHVPRLRAYDSSAFSTAPSVSLNGNREVLSAFKTAGLVVTGTSAHITDIEITGNCDATGINFSGTNNFINGALIQCLAQVGLLVDAESECNRVSQVKVHGSIDNDTLITDASVRVEGNPAYPEVQMDGVEVCGPGVTSIVTYGCNVEPNDCSNDPCDSCADRVCDEDSPLGDGVSSQCWDEQCWPPPELRQNDQFSTCTQNATLWDLTAPIKCTRAVPLTFMDLTAGTMSNMWRPLSFDCLVEAELNVWTDDYPGAVGDTEVILYNDESGLSVTLTCPSTDALVTELVGWEIYPRSPFYNQTQIRAEIVSVTTPVTNVWIGVTLRFP